MWGIHTIRALWLYVAILAILGGNGCCHCCKKPAQEAKELPTISAEDHRYWPSDKPRVLKPEQIHGGII